MPPQRLALVTGAASGLAQGVAVRLAQTGYRLALTYRPGGTPPHATQKKLAPYQDEAPTQAVDFNDLDRSGVALADLLARTGPVDILVHAVGPMIIRRFIDCSLSDYRAMVDGNLTSAVITAAAVLPAMREQQFGRLVFFGINGAHNTVPARGLSFHLAAKAGLVAFARTLSLEEAGNGITVNVVEPGDIRDKDRNRRQARQTPARNPRGRAGSWEDVADAVRFLVSDEADFINGAVLGVNGGLVEPYERNAGLL
ncbi:MAG: SDR family oxidoreductase [Candidatus Eremiobacteraeota bacterium]|nr:SDR family oxidoreductase [Candidatus Eremiobacteraeota bacterium]